MGESNPHKSKGKAARRWLAARALREANIFFAGGAGAARGAADEESFTVELPSAVGGTGKGAIGESGAAGGAPDEEPTEILR